MPIHIPRVPKRGQEPDLVALAMGPVAREDVPHEVQLDVAVGLEEAGREVPLQGAVHGRRVLPADVTVVLRPVLRVRVQPQPPVRVRRGPRGPPARPRQRRRHAVSVPHRHLLGLVPSLRGAVQSHGGSQHRAD